jgi:hypothetical protein
LGHPARPISSANAGLNDLTPLAFVQNVGEDFPEGIRALNP